MKTFYFLLITGFLTVAISGQSQTKSQIDSLHAFAGRKASLYLIKKSQAVEWAKRNGYPVTAEIDGSFVEIQYIDENGRPQYYKTDNANAAATISTNKVYSGGGVGLSLTGSGISVREWDGGSVLSTHQEFGTRVTVVDPVATHYHATHVAGTIMASGVVAAAKGMAFAANLRSFDWNSDVSEMATEGAAGALISNHSYGYIRGWSSGIWYGDPGISTQEDYLFGFYDSYTQDWDEVALNAPYFLICKSAGNDRGESGTGYPPDGPYDCIGQQGVAKNILTVGAVNDIVGGYTTPSSVVMSSFSSWGPADDGRIKPDIVANGIGLYSTYNTNNTSYESLSGTSMATPSVAGSLALLQQHYYALKGSYMRSATLKALVIHTADEAGPDPGPDYMFGWGLMNTKNAALKISADQTTDVISELTLNNGGIYSRGVIALGTEPLKVTIVWTDQVGTPPAASLDPITPMLVNDLDLRINRSSNTYYPWKLDRNNPVNAATNTAENNVDNVEVIYIASPIAGASYTITVDHDGTIAGGPQAYAMIISGISSSVPPVADFMANNITPSINTQVNFTDLSSNVPTSWSWSFSPSTITYLNGTTSTSQHPQVQFNATGSYSVTLTAANAYGSDIETKTNYINATNCTISSFPWNEGFENGGTIPNCWTQQAVTGALNWAFTSGSPLGNPATSHAGSYNASFYEGAYGTNNVTKLISPPLNLASLSSPQLKFWHTQPYWNPDQDELRVYYKTSSGGSWILLATYTNSIPSWTQETLDLPAQSSEYYIAFEGTEMYGYGICIDDVTVFGTITHDASTLSIDMEAFYTTGSFTPKATVKNLGTITETFPVTITIGAYTSTKAVTALAPNATRQVTFDAWTAVAGDYTVQVCTQLGGDLNSGNDCKSQQVKILNLNKQVYGYNAYPDTGPDPEGPMSFNLSSPGTLNSLANQSAMNFVAGGTWAEGVWYGTVYNTAAPYDFISINPITGARTLIGTQTVGFNGLSYNPANANMYGVAWDGANSTLYSINRTTGATTFIGNCVDGILINLSINNAGQAYAVNIGTDVFGSVNLATGAFTSIGSIGFDANYAQDMEFDRETGELYMAAYSTSGWLGWVNQTTGATLKIGDFEGGAEVTGLAIPYTNAAPVAFAVTGGGSCCQNSGGLPVGLADSEIGVIYTLFKNGVAQSPTVNGTGSAIGFGNQLSGTYTVSGTNGGGTTAMTGSAVITENPAVGTPVFTLGATSTRCQAAGSVTYVATATNNTGITYTLDASSLAGGNSINPATGAVTYVAGWSGASLITASAAGCSGPATAVHTVTITPTLPVTVSIAASANPVNSGTSVTFTAIPTNGGQNPFFQWKVNATNAGSNNPIYSYIPINGDAVTCILTSNLSCITGNPATSNSIIMTVTEIPAIATVTGNVTGTVCYNATQTINVAGNGTTFIVQNGGVVTMIAGQVIHYLPGTTVQSGGYMWGYIAPNGPFCVTPSMPAVITGEDELLPIAVEKSFFKVYPNPTTGNFTLELTGEVSADKITVDIYGIRGERVLTDILYGERKHEFSLSDRPVGVYFICVILANNVETLKIIKY